MIEPEPATRHKGNVGEDIVFRHRDLAILQVFVMCLDHFIDQTKFFHKDCAACTIEIRTG
jgi:hypothetical protein